VSIPERQVLLEHVGFLRAIALGVLHNEADADDVVQQTLAVALEKPPRDATNLRGWLATVARNVARMQYRSRKRREAREERVARAEGTAATFEIAERMEMERRVVEAIATLKEPFRTTLVLRYYDDLQPKQIAERMGVPAATVRTRLKRGLTKLRERLERDSDSDRKTMYAGLLLLAQMPKPRGAGGLVRVGAAALVLVGVALTVWLVRDASVPPTGTKAARADATARGPTVPGALDRDDAPPALVRIRGRVFDERGRPLRAARVTAYAHERRGRLQTPARRHDRWMLPRHALLHADTDTTGAYSLSLPPSQPVWLVATAGGDRRPDSCRLLDVTQQLADLDFRLDWTEPRFGRIVNARNEPITDAWVQVWDERRSETWLPGDIEAQRTDAFGRFRLRWPAVGARGWGRGERWLRLRIIARGYAPRVLGWGRNQRVAQIRRGPGLRVSTSPGTRVLVLTKSAIDSRYSNGWAEFDELPGEVRRVVMLPSGGRRARAYMTYGSWDDHSSSDVTSTLGDLRARLVSSDKPVMGAEIGIAHGGLMGAWFPFAIDCMAVVQTGKDGSFHLPGFAPNVGMGIAIAHPSLQPGLVEANPGEPVVRVRPAAQLNGVVLREDGSPAAGVRLVAGWSPDGGLAERLAARHQPLWSAVSRVDGTFTIEQLPARRPTQLFAWHPRFGSAIVPLSEVGNGPITLRPREPAIPASDNEHVRGSVRDASGAAVVGARIRSPETLEVWATTDAQGLFELTDVATATLLIETPHGIRRVVPVAHGGVVVPAVRELAGRITHAGQPLAGAQLRVIDGARTASSTRSGADGRYVVKGMPNAPDAYLEISHAGYRTRRVENPSAGDIELQRAPDLLVRVHDVNGNPVGGVGLRIGGRRELTSDSGAAQFAGLAEGVGMPIVVPGDSGWILTRAVQVGDGVASVVLTVAIGPTITGRVGLPHTLVLATPLRAGLPTRRTFSDSKGNFVVRALHADRYRLSTGAGRRVTEVDAGARDVYLREENR